MSARESIRLCLYQQLHRRLLSRKLGPMKSKIPEFRQKRVLELGCGPGTLAPLMQHAARYRGLDIDAQAIELARANFPWAEFAVADISAPLTQSSGPFDVVIIHSVLHHLDDSAAAGALENVSSQLSPEGRFYLIDLLLPGSVSVAYLLAKLDRGDFPRREEEWKRLVEVDFEACEQRRFSLRVFGLVGWHLWYFEGRPRRTFSRE